MAQQKHIRSPKEIEEALHSQIDSMRASCTFWDAGMDFEAKRIATAIYVLVHDGGRDRSILTQLGKRDAIEYMSTATELSPQLPLALVMVRARNRELRFIPFCMDPVRWGFFHDMAFKRWWKEPIFRSSTG